MKFGFEQTIFDAMFTALKPGGILGIVEHRADPDEFPDPQALSGYVQEEQVKQMANEAGFEFVSSSDILENPKDVLTTSVFAPELRGKTHRFVYVFRKPG